MKQKLGASPADQLHAKIRQVTAEIDHIEDQERALAIEKSKLDRCLARYQERLREATGASCDCEALGLHCEGHG